MVRNFQKPPSVEKLIADALKPPATTVVSEAGQVTTIPDAPEPAETQGRAEEGEAHPVENVNAPWADKNPRVISFFQIRMPEPLKVKLEWLHARQFGEKRESQHAIALAALEREVNRMIAKIQKGGK